ncbi:GTP 3',8-cyclase MoaA [Acinetobacter sp. MD2(2019)]|uniref:GTP 3',8-cyclase MoaA n=1 Tax=Acinetobacter sp. MD2(2019) TaxID=2605273 RepID=UPI002D1EE35B|nr:GTP 3',8-cyclase MoaA [Acinetobacter sp. MD2(2019)]MEB3754347.1 GTP 3',8-cyclase MoaA [Acinetobacter sp. MD2(2019)]
MVHTIEEAQSQLHSSLTQSQPVLNLPDSQLIDQFQRQKRKLRISLTDRCNFKCSYCMPDHPEWLAKHDILSFEELEQFCEVMVKLGINQIRLTGGEPLMRKGVVSFIYRLNRLRVLGLTRISMTTNAYYLEHYADELKKAGLDDLNISLDSIRPETFLDMTKKPLAPVLAGISAAQKANIPIKINCVLVQGQNDQQVLELVQCAYQQQIELRFIEYMPLDQPQHWAREKVVIEDEIIDILSPHFQLEALPRNHDPATVYLLNQSYKLGIISTISKPFCQTCDRLRLTATGELFTCLFANTGTPIRALLKPERQQDLIQQILDAVWYKKAGYIAYQAAPIRKISMHSIGG